VCRVEQPEEGANVIVYETSVYEKKSIGLARTIHKQLTSLFIWFAYSVHHYCVHHCSMLIPVCIIPVCINTVCFIEMCLQCGSLMCASLQCAYYSVHHYSVQQYSVLITVCILQCVSIQCASLKCACSVHHYCVHHCSMLITVCSLQCAHYILANVRLGHYTLLCWTESTHLAHYCSKSPCLHEKLSSPLHMPNLQLQAASAAKVKDQLLICTPLPWARTHP
jgi:hypothetical protein